MQNSKTFYKLLSISIISTLVLAIALTSIGYYLQVKSFTEQFDSDAINFGNLAIEQLDKMDIVNQAWNYDTNLSMQKELTAFLDATVSASDIVFGAALLDITNNSMMSLEAQSSIYHEMGLPLGEKMELPPATVPAIKEATATKKPQMTDVFSDETGSFKTMVYPVLNDAGKIVMYFTHDYEASSIANVKKAFLINSIIVSLIVLLIIIGVQVVILTSIFKPLKDLFMEVEEVGKGNLAVQVEYHSNSEIGKLGNLLDDTIRNLRAVILKTQNIVTEIETSSHNLTESTDEALNRNREIDHLITDITNGAKYQAGSAEKSEVIIGQLAEAVQHIAVNTQEVAENSTEMAKEAEQGHKQLGNVINQMTVITDNVKSSTGIISLLRDKSQEINQIVSVINGISDQTNLLALNASIEAARAGEHGKGFAVVADEVRKLAEESSESTNKIAGLINEIQSGIDQAVDSMVNSNNESAKGQTMINEVSLKLETILNNTFNIADQINDISASTEEISASSDTIVSAAKDTTESSSKFLIDAEQINNLSIQHLDSFESINESIRSVAGMTEDLTGLLEEFKV